ncbi:MAG: N4-gp56 family major capsid protein [Caldisericia bacterium]|nr:N4-gp56 family major capsid protein [Caldisericia bacterium]
MPQLFNEGGYPVAQTNSSIGQQINDKHYSKAAVIEAKRVKTFSQMGDKLTQPKHFGDKIVKYHEIPILDDRNVNDQGIDANGVKMIIGVWYAFDAAGTRIVTGADADGSQGFSTKQLAWAAAGATGSIKSGNGNLFGSSKDMLVQNGSFPALTEEGGMVNRVGMKRLLIEANVTEYGFYMSFTKKSLDMDTETGLLARYSREVGVAQGDIREAQIRNSLIGKSETNRVFAGDATAMDEVGSDDILGFSDLRMMDKALKDARCPRSTKLIDGSTKYGTTTVGKARYAYVGQEALPTLEDMQHNSKDVWSPVEDYASAGTIAMDEIGRIGPFRFIEVEDMPNYSGQGADTTDTTDDADLANRYTSVGADGVVRYDVFPVLFVGSGSFATVGFEGDVARVVTVLPKADAHNDVYGKKGAVSISWYYGIMFLQPTWIRQISCSMAIA